MRNETRALFKSYVSQIALINNVPDASEPSARWSSRSSKKRSRNPPNS